jgi:putative aldouronate transport system permease protein
MQKTIAKVSPTVRTKRTVIKKIHRRWQLYFVMLLPLAYLVIFHYTPMYGVQIAFKNFIVTKGIVGSPWIGFAHFQRFFKSYQFLRLIKNTLGISFYSLAAGFPVPIILAILINEVGARRFKKTVQMVTYAPHFISTIVMVAIILQVLDPKIGLVNRVIDATGGDPINFIGVPEYFKTIYVASGVWQNAGYSSIIYIAALSSIDPQLEEAAIIDGASKLQKIWHIDIPGILPTAVILLILNMGRIMNIGFEKIFLMQNPLNMVASDVISTYVYRTGLVSAQYSFSAAVGLFNSVINLILIVSVNQAARRMGETSLW